MWLSLPVLSFAPLWCRQYCAAWPPPTWPDKSELKRIGLEFLRLTGGNLTGWCGMYVYFASFFLHCCLLLLSVRQDPLLFGCHSG